MASPEDPHAALLQVLEGRFARNLHRHGHLSWAVVRARIERNAPVLGALQAMESTGGEPDVVAVESAQTDILFIDCSPESPSGRRSLCFDGQAREARKAAKPASSAREMAAGMGLELLTEPQYLAFQQYGDFDTRTSSWIDTPPDVRARGGALFADRRYGRVFVYHNGAQSYYAARGFRGLIRV